jgi:hypothetical protein
LSIVWKQRKIFTRPKDSSTRVIFTENGKVTRRQMTIATRYRDKHESLLHLAVGGNWRNAVYYSVTGYALGAAIFLVCSTEYGLSQW